MQLYDNRGQDKKNIWVYESWAVLTKCKWNLLKKTSSLDKWQTMKIADFLNGIFQSDGSWLTNRSSDTPENT